MWPAPTERVDERQLGHQTRLFERKLECDPTTERGADQHHGAQAAIFDVALNKTREVLNGVASAGLFRAAVSGQVRREHTMVSGRSFEREPPLHVARRTQAVDEDHG